MNASTLDQQTARLDAHTLGDLAATLTVLSTKNKDIIGKSSNCSIIKIEVIADSTTGINYVVTTTDTMFDESKTIECGTYNAARRALASSIPALAWSAESDNECVWIETSVVSGTTSN